jgi:hypothetical protein
MAQPATYMVFDLLGAAGFDLRALPLLVRGEGIKWQVRIASEWPDFGRVGRASDTVMANS